jgi:hypothetical protein
MKKKNRLLRSVNREREDELGGKSVDQFNRGNLISVEENVEGLQGDSMKIDSLFIENSPDRLTGISVHGITEGRTRRKSYVKMSKSEMSSRGKQPEIILIEPSET